MNLDPQVLSGAGIVMLIGLGIVFIGLIVIIALLYIQAAVFKNAGKQEKKAAAPAPAPAPAPVPQAASADEDEEIAAVIAAAVALMAQEGANSLVVRSVRRVGANTPAWGLSGRQEYVNTRY